MIRRLGDAFAGAFLAYVAFTAMAFRRAFAYRIANWAGLFTNAFFLFFRAYALGACFTGRESIGTMRMQEVLTYTTLSQALLMVVPMWGNMGLSYNVRSGQIAVELSRPIDYFLMHMSQRFGVGAYYVLARFTPMMIIGAAMGFLAGPAGGVFTLAALILSVLLGAWIANCLLFLVEVSSFWMESDRGMRGIVQGLSLVAGGLIIPLHFFPGWAYDAANALPFRYLSYFSVELYLGKLDAGATCSAFGMQFAWAAALTLLCRRALARGSRKLVIHGG